MLRYSYRVWRDRRRLVGDADLIVAHDIYLLPLAYVLSKVMGLPFVYDAHEEYAMMEGGRFPDWWLRLATRIESLLAGRSQAIIVPGRTRLDRWSRAGVGKIVVLRNLGRDIEVEQDQPVRWDITNVFSNLDQDRPPDLLIEVARRRPDLRIMFAGTGQLVDEVEKAAEELPNLEFLGWRSDSDALLAQGRTVFYGLYPQAPYSPKACPNTLYQALHVQKPLIFFCEGEPAELAREYKIGIQCAASVEGIIAAYESAVARDDWQFEEALTSIAEDNGKDAYGEVISSVINVARMGKRVLR